MDARVEPAHDEEHKMPMIDADGCLLNVSVEGRDGGPTLMLSNSLGCTLQMWEPQMKALTQLFRVIRYDRRGHGKSNVPAGPYTMERFGRDVLAILDDLNIEKVHWCGLSMGGMVGQWLGANAPERFGKLILANTSCYYAEPTKWLERIDAVKKGGIAAVADAVIAGWLTADFREREPQITARMKAMLLATPVEGYLACCEALSTLDQRELLPKIKSPTLVVAGRPEMTDPEKQHGRPETPRCRHECAPKSAGQCMGRQVDRGPQCVQHRLPGHDHALRLGRDLDPAAFRRAHAAGAGDRHHGRARAMGRIPPACACGARGGRLHPRRHQGNSVAAGDLLRRPGGEPRRERSLSHCAGARPAQGLAARVPRQSAAPSRAVRSPARWPHRAEAGARWHAAEARPSRRPSRPSSCSRTRSGCRSPAQ